MLEIIFVQKRDGSNLNFITERHSEAKSEFWRGTEGACEFLEIANRLVQ